MVLRFADADVLPYDFSDFADTMHKYSDEVKKLLKDRQDEIRERDQNLADGVYAATSDPRRPTVAPPKEEEPPFINFAPLDNALVKLDASAARYSKAIKAFDSSSNASAADGNTTPASSKQLQELNQTLIETERKLSDAQGLPRRPWYQNLIYAPGFYTGYGAKTLPGVREGIEEKRYAEAEQQVTRVAKALEDYAESIDQAAEELEQTEKR
jgi:N-acetylated-alpha-linked acidic dipeptidase